MYLTNVRIVWHANLASNFNVICLYMQIKNIVLRNSKFGRALVIETLQRAGGFILGFRVDPLERLEPIEREMRALFKTYGATPIFGVEFSFEEDPPDLTKTMLTRVEEDVEVVEDALDNHAVSAYFAEEEDALEEEADDGEPDKEKIAERRRERERNQVPVFDTNLGLAVEKVPGNSDIASLWRIM